MYINHHNEEYNQNVKGNWLSLSGKIMGSFLPVLCVYIENDQLFHYQS